MQAAIVAVHDQSARPSDIDWSEILSLYGLLEPMTGNPMVILNRPVAAAMASGPETGLALLDGLGERLGDHHRLHSFRAHLLDRPETPKPPSWTSCSGCPHYEPEGAAVPHHQSGPPHDRLGRLVNRSD